MIASTLVLLARPAAVADRGRAALLIASTAVASGLLLAAERIARYHGESHQVVRGFGRTSVSAGLAPYLEQSGLRPGVVFGALLLTVPVLALTVQALRTGSVARGRRLAALRLAGATPGDVRRVSSAEAATAAAVGGLLGGPIYLALWALLGVLPPSDLRLLPPPTPLDVLAWAVVVVLMAVAGGIAGAAVERRILIDPIDAQRRAAPPRPTRLRWLVLSLPVTVFALLGVRHRALGGYGIEAIAVTGALIMAFSMGSRWVRWLGLRMSAGASAVDVLAGCRLAAEPRAAGRVAAVLVIGGVAIGIEAGLVADLFSTGGPLAEDRSFYLNGYVLAGIGVLVAVAVGVLTLIIGAADQLVDARRSLAALTALGVEESTLLASLGRQLTAASVPAVMGGVVVGDVVINLLLGAYSRPIAFLGSIIVAAGLAGFLISLIGRLAARLLRSRVRAATDPENLRVA